MSWYSSESRATSAPREAVKTRKATCSVSHSPPPLAHVTYPDRVQVHIRDAQFSRARQEDRPIRYSARASVSGSVNSHGAER